MASKQVQEAQEAAEKEMNRQKKEVEEAEKEARRVERANRRNEEETAKEETERKKSPEDKVIERLDAFEKALGNYMETGENLAVLLMTVPRSATFSPAALGQSIRMTTAACRVAGLELLRGHITTKRIP